MKLTHQWATTVGGFGVSGYGEIPSTSVDGHGKIPRNNLVGGY